MKFLGVFVDDKRDVREKGQGPRSKFKVTEVNNQLSRLRTLTAV